MNTYDEDPSVFTAHYEVEVLINRPVGPVWRQFLDISSWVTSHKIELVSGALDAVGGITRVSAPHAVETGLPRPHHHFCKIITLVPERHYVLKTYADRGGSYGLQLSCFDDARFDSIDGKTKVTFNLFA